MKRAYYLTTDDVNGHLAEQLARREGVELTILNPHGSLPAEGVLICDWDFLGDELRQQVLERNSHDVLLVLHSYDLEFQRQRHMAWQHRVVIYRRLDGQVFVDLGLGVAAA